MKRRIRKVLLQLTQVAIVKRNRTAVDGGSVKRVVRQHNPDTAKETSPQSHRFPTETTPKEVIRASKRRIARGKRTADVAAVPFRQTRKIKRRFKNAKQRSDYRKAKRRPKFQNPQPTRKSAHLIDKGMERKNVPTEVTSQPSQRRRLQLIKYPTYQGFCLIRMKKFRNQKGSAH